MIKLQLIIGTTGLVVLLMAFSLNAVGILKTTSPFYSIFNSIGAFLLALYALSIRSYIFTVLNIIWGLFGVIKLISILKNKH